MIHEAIETVYAHGVELAQTQARAERKVEFIDDPHDRRRYGVRLGENPPEWLERPNFRAHTVSDLASLAAAVARWASESDAASGPGATLWISSAEVVFLLDDGARLDQVTLPLEASRARRAIEQLVGGEPLAQKPLEWLLRTDLYGVIPREQLLDKVKRIRWSSGQTVDATAGSNARESLSWENVSSAAWGDAEPPDTVRADFYWWDGFGELSPVFVDLAVATSYEDRKIGFRDVGTGLKGAEFAALEQLRDAIEEKLAEAGATALVSTFFGRP